ncbi:SAVMC3_10250 family protein [Streptomyces sp. NPDC058745]|uniref:SAVMC3_10250 family protein n=1 Tax=Streptomyces sp. NPDC058745 TaxID=3346621 RepID=UPI0036C99AB7
MRELLYLSDSKLRQFVRERRRSHTGFRLTAFRATTPVGGLEVEAAADSDTDRQKQKHLALVVRHIEEQALWFQDPVARAGQWVYFEAPLNVFVTYTQPDTVMFIDTQPGAVDEYDQPDGARLLLHGSSSHLLSTVPYIPLEYEPIGRQSGPPVPTMTLAALSEVSLPTAEDQAGSTPVIKRPGSLPSKVHKLFRAAQNATSVRSAVWMRGYARITATIGISKGGRTPCVLATPLYVEYANDLP